MKEETVEQAAERLKETIARKSAEESRYYQGAIDGINLLLNNLTPQDTENVTEIKQDSKSKRSPKKV